MAECKHDVSQRMICRKCFNNFISLQQVLKIIDEEFSGYIPKDKHPAQVLTQIKERIRDINGWIKYNDYICNNNRSCTFRNTSS